MSAAWDTRAIATAFAEAALDSSKWNSAMDAVAFQTGSVGAVMLPVPVRPVALVPMSEALGPVAETYFRQGWDQHDLRYRSGPKLLRDGAVSDLDYTTPDEIKRSPYYQDFLGQHGLCWFGGVKVAAGDDSWCVSIQRSVEQGPFSPRELKRLAALSGPLSSTAAMARALSFARAEGALSAFEFGDLAAVLLDLEAKALRLNEAAERLLRGGDLAILNGRIVSADREAMRRLHLMLQAVASPAGAAALGAPVALPRAGSRRPVIAYAMRLAAAVRDVFAAGQAMLILIDLDARMRPPEAVLRQALGLSRAEARLASKLGAGETLEHVAEELTISKETARHELKSVFAKLDVHRQSELVAVLAKLLRGS